MTMDERIRFLMDAAARADRIGDRDRVRGDEGAAPGSDAARAFRAFGDAYEAWTMGDEAPGGDVYVAVVFKPGEILVRQFHDVREGDQPGDPVAIGRLVVDE